ncbi:MAG TPA: hypothetical protein VGP96_10175 [Candidatus Dormibacteraeota bacterium]|nr:hypothetical protein [Candidatus Dormibacteraeota bacterium]
MSMAVASAPTVIAEDVALRLRLRDAERRDLEVRGLREEVATRYGLSPADLAPLGRWTLRKMASHIDSGMVRVTIYRVEVRGTVPGEA